MSRVATWVGVLAILSGLANILLFVLWWNVVTVSANMPVSERGYTVEALSLQITLLEMVLVVAGFGLAGLGILGYIEIKNMAVQKATDAGSKAAKEEADRQFKQWRELQEARNGRDMQIGQSESSGSYSIAAAEPETIEKAGERE